MNEITTKNAQLPSTIEDLSKFVLIGREKLVAVRAEIRAIDKIGLAQEVRQQKLSEAQDIAEAVLDAEVRIGQLMAEVPKSKNNNPTGLNQHARGQIDSGVDLTSTEPEGKPQEITDNWDEILESEPEPPKESPKTKAEVVAESGFTQKQIERFQTMAAHPEIVQQAKAEARESDNIVSRDSILKKVKAEEKKQQILEAEQAISSQAAESFKPRLYIGDCLKYKPTEKYDLLLTDPPYSTDVDDIEQFVNSWLYNALDNVKDTGFAYVFIGAYPDEINAYSNAKLPPHIRLHQYLIWTYKNTLGNNPKDGYKQNYQMCLFYRGINAPDLDCPLTTEQWAVQEINAPDGRQGDRYHAWQKPMEIAERFIRHSTKPGMTVYDPFACTGTFLLAASKLGRKAYGYEINPDNAEIAFKRGCIRSE